MSNQLYNSVMAQNPDIQAQMNKLLQQTNQITQSSSSPVCDADCQYQKTANQLKQDVVKAENTLATAPSGLNTAVKNYVVYTQGEVVYNEDLEEQYGEEADAAIVKLEETANEKSGEISTDISSYSNLLLNYNNVLELYKTYLEENLQLTQELQNESNDILTNDRKTFYEDQNINSLNFVYYYILIPIYIICVISFGIFSFAFSSQMNVKVKIAILLMLIILPFFSTKILGFIIKIVYAIYNLLPKNASLSI
jgi:hypothetical protein